jgi:phage host-nuclease inhibitor protein Gam
MTDSLQENLTETPEDFHEEAWRIDGFETANWAMRKLKAAQERLDAINRQALDEAAKISDWANRVSAGPLRDKTYFENALAHYLLELRRADENTKSLVLIDGEVNSRSVPAKAVVSDADVFKKWASDNGHPEFIRIKSEVDLSALKDAVRFDGDLVILEETGEVIDGLLGIEADVSVTVHVSK